MSLIDELKLPVDKLRTKARVEELGFRSTDEICCEQHLIGQERAVSSISFGLSMESKGYNIFVVGNPGSGRTTYAMNRIMALAKDMPAPDDWVYAYNFSNPSAPLAINMPAGQGRELAKELDELVKELKIVLSKTFEDSQYEDTKARYVKEFQEQVNEYMEELRKAALERGFSIKRTPQGFVNVPLVKVVAEDGNVTYREMQQEEFEALGEEERKELQGKSEEISQKTLEVLRRIRDLEKSLRERIKELEANICRSAIGPYLKELKDRFGANGKLRVWIDELSEDIIKNFNIFIAAARDENAEVDFSRYGVNVIVENKPEEGAPVIRETNPTYYNLIGKVEYESRQGYLYTDFTKIVAGAIHKANGGFLILEAEELFRHFLSWEALKRVLKTGQLTIENIGEQWGYIPFSSLRPEPIPMDVKVVIIGTRWIYYLLNLYDPEFSKLFKVKADFDVDMPRTVKAERDLANFVAGFTQKEKLPPFTADAVGEVIEWASRLADHGNRMTTRFNQLAEVLVEAAAWARKENGDRVAAPHVRKAISEKQFRMNLVEERMRRAFEDGTLYIDTRGEKVGQVNGLTVVDLVDHRFAHPVRITANVFMGREGVVNIEREVKLTGPIHNKGLLTLSSYLGRQYAQDMPLALSAHLAFEQVYGGIEGDSASSTELYCLVSALSDLPLKQSIGVTGSVDQFGNIQPIGGVNEKIEGFFKYCKVQGLTGDQGVMIPESNVVHLMLDHEVMQAVQEGKFHIWAIRHVDEGIEILTGVPAGKMDEAGNFPEGTVHARAKQKLRTFMERSAKLKKELGEEPKKSEDEGNG